MDVSVSLEENCERKLLVTYFGKILVTEDVDDYSVAIENNLLLIKTEFRLSSRIIHFCCTHNYAIFLTDSRIYMLRIDSTQIFSFDIRKSPDEWNFTQEELPVISRSLAVKPRDSLPELAHCMNLDDILVSSLSTKYQCQNKESLICATATCCFLIRNADNGPSLYRIFSERTIHHLQLLQLDCELPIVQVSAGNDHVLLLSEAGKVYSFGTGSRGELGHGCLRCEEQPRLIEALSTVRVVQIACGFWHSLAVTSDGEVYGWGWNRNGEIDDRVERAPDILDLPFPIQKDRCGLSAVGAYRTSTVLAYTDGNVSILGDFSYNTYDCKSR